MFDAEEVERQIEAARWHAAKIRNGAYFNARLAELARLFRPDCASQTERHMLKAKLLAAVRHTVSGQCAATRRHVARVLGAH